MPAPFLKQELILNSNRWNPSRLPGVFAWYDANYPATLFQDAAGTIPAAGTDPVGRMNSLIAGAPFFSIGTDGRRPTLGTFSGAIRALVFDGVDDALQSSSTNAWKFLHDGTGATVFLQFKYSTGNEYIFDNSDGTSVNVGFSLFANAGATALSIIVGAGGSSALSASSTAGTANSATETRLSFKYEYVGGATNTANWRFNGVADAADTAAVNPPSASNPSFALTLAASGNGFTFPNGLTLARAIFCTGTAAFSQAELVEAWMLR